MKIEYSDKDAKILQDRLKQRVIELLESDESIVVNVDTNELSGGEVLWKIKAFDGRDEPGL